MGAPQVTEIAYIPLKPSLDLSSSSSSTAAKIWTQTTTTIASQPGCLGINYGRTVESPDLLIMMIHWKLLQDHKDFEARSIHAKMLKNLTQILNGPVQIFHWTPNPGYEILSTAPMIEFALFVKIQPEFPGAVGKFIDGVGVPDGGNGWASGAVVEEGVRKHGDFMGGKEGEGKEKEGRAFVLLGGWESVDAHMRFRETEVFKENVGYLRGNHGGVEMFHLAFTAVDV